MTIEQILHCIIETGKKYNCREIYLFGSRAKNTNRERSDIDIAVVGAVDFELLRDEVEQIPTLYTIDLVNMDTCGNKLLLEDIKTYGRKIYEAI